MSRKKIHIIFLIFLVLVTAGVILTVLKIQDMNKEITATYLDFTEKDIAYDHGTLYIDSQLLLTAKEDVSYEEVEHVLQRYKAEIVGYISISNDYQVSLPADTEYEKLCEIADELSHDEKIELCMLNYVYPMDGASIDYMKDPWIPASDPQDKSGAEWSEIKPQGSNWWAEAVKLPSVWNMDIWDDDTQFIPANIGVIDTVFDPGNTDLQNVFRECWQNPSEGSGENQVSYLYSKESDAEKRAELSHGTHVAGIISAKGGNGFGITGAASCADPQLYGYATKGENEHFYTDLMMWKYAIALMLKEDVRVINISMGTDSLIYAASKGNAVALKTLSSYSTTMERFLKKCIEQGYEFVITKSAGNTAGCGWKECEASKEFPYGYMQTEGTSEPCDVQFDVLGAIKNTKVRDRIVVGATRRVPFSLSKDTRYEIAEFSNIGADVYAPGDRILSTIPGNEVDYKDGTSMSAPIVAGTAALMWSVNPELTAKQVKEILIESTDTEGTDEEVSNINAFYAVNAAQIKTGMGEEEEGKNGCILGEVYTWSQVDENSEPDAIYLNDADVYVYDENNSEILKLRPDSLGSFDIFLPAGSYLIKIQKEGYVSFELNVKLKENEVISHSFEMTPAYEWVVRPEVSADNIFYMKDTNAGNASYNELHRQFMSDYAVVKQGGKYGLIDMNGEFLAEPVYDRISLQMNSYYIDNGQADNSYYVTEDGEILPGTEPALAVGIVQQPAAFYYSDELHHVLENAIDIMEPLDRPQEAIPVQKAKTEIPREGDQRVFWNWWEEIGGKYAIYNEDALVSEFTYDECGSCSDGLFAVCKNGKWGYVDKSGQPVTSMIYDASWEEYSDDDTTNISTSQCHDPYCYAASDGYIVLKKDNYWELRDVEGNLIIPSGIFDKICPVYKEKCWVKTDGRWGVIQINKQEEENVISDERRIVGSWINEENTGRKAAFVFSKDGTVDFGTDGMEFYDAHYYFDENNLIIKMAEADASVTFEIEFIEKSPEEIIVKAIDSSDDSVLELSRKNVNGTYTKHVAKITSEDYKNVYGPILKQVCDTYSASNIYYCYDIDKNGIKELIVQEGTDYQSYVFKVYTIGNGESVYLGDISGYHCSFYRDESGGQEPYIIRSEGMNQYSRVSHIRIEDGSLVEEVVSETEHSGYYSNSYPLTEADVSFDALLEGEWYE